MTTKFHNVCQTWAKWAKFGKEHAFWQWNFVGTVFRLPLPHPDIFHWEHAIFTNLTLHCWTLLHQNLTMIYMQMQISI